MRVLRYFQIFLKHFVILGRSRFFSKFDTYFFILDRTSFYRTKQHIYGIKLFVKLKSRRVLIEGITL